MTTSLFLIVASADGAPDISTAIMDMSRSASRTCFMRPPSEIRPQGIIACASGRSSDRIEAARSARRHAAAEVQGVVDHPQGLDAGAGPANGDIAVIEDAAEDGLVDVHALDLVHVHLDGVPSDQTPLEDHAAVGDRELGADAPDPGPKPRDDRAHG